MKKSLLIGLFLFQFALNGFAQKSINNFKYVIVPETFGFLDEPNKYNMNALTKFLLNKKGFDAYMENEAPADLNDNGCNAMYANVLKDKGGLFKTKVQVQLKDCYGNILLTSRLGETREKEYEKAYQLALRDAFEGTEFDSYSYEPTSTPEKTIVVADVPVKKELAKSPPKNEPKNEEKVELIQIQETPKVETIKEPAVAVSPSDDTQWLYAQPLENGYQLIDMEPKKVMVLLNTSLKDVYLVKDKNALVYKDGNQWIMSSTGTEVTKEVLHIKF